VVRPFEHEAEVTAELAVIGGEDHVDVVAPPEALDVREHSAERLVEQLALDRVSCRDLSQLVGVRVAGTHLLGAS